VIFVQELKPKLTTMKTKKQTNGPDMTAETRKERAALRAEELRLMRDSEKDLKAAKTQLERLEKVAAKQVAALAKQMVAEVKQVNKALTEARKPVQKEIARLSAGKAVNERLAAIRKRLAILEGRSQ
jgi:uncharacterized HAD superfamily protein